MKNQLRYIEAKGDTLEEMRENARKDPMIQHGDMKLVWVNEGDLCNHILSGTIPTPFFDGDEDDERQWRAVVCRGVLHDGGADMTASDDDKLIRLSDAIAAVQSSPFPIQAIAALPAVQEVVKPLEWVYDEMRGVWSAQDGFGRHYTVSDSQWFHGSLSEFIWVDGGDEAAKAAAQADYEARIRSELTAQPSPDVTVWYGSMPESNGKSNWTASLHRKGDDAYLDGFCFARSEYPDRVRYMADRMRWIIGELAEKPDVLSYDPDLHSGYAEPAQPSPDVAALVALMPEVIASLDATDCNVSLVRDLRAALARAKGGA